MTVVTILGVLATIAIGAYTRQIRKARKAEVIGDLSAITLRQKTFLSVNGHYASSARTEGASATYPTGSQVTATNGTEFHWEPEAGGYTGEGLGDGEYTRGGESMHGFDALRFMPEGGRSYCGYATTSGWGTDATDDEGADEPPEDGIGGLLFPRGTPEAESLYSRDWFYSYAICDFDLDGTYWALRTASYTSDINFTSFGEYAENE